MIKDSYEYLIIVTPQRLQLHLLQHTQESTQESSMSICTDAANALEEMISEARSKILRIETKS
ncbi:hypothetical protein BN59_02532 [Legionella massiliensis]|uniref:Uncharacterized protein n=1 Tax=Legionella massiliensis TaxID=1034943 RepID=A0A078L2A7_9GAMM|nr:hypothetical protein [Legionella massiliensis]CDZ78224.1 hypothetical protein BN59_02532 [Legionella massiliensis]CEE13962.1 hypothetical protein BN1094_02532 [Legionella massiliensis]